MLLIVESQSNNSCDIAQILSNAKILFYTIYVSFLYCKEFFYDNVFLINGSMYSLAKRWPTSTSA